MSRREDVKEEFVYSEWLSSDCVTPREAIDLLIVRADTELEAKEAIADGLRSKRVRCCADTIWHTERGSVFDETWHPAKDALSEIDVSEFFSDSRQWPAEVTH